MPQDTNPDFPLMLYRAPGTQEIHGGRFDTLVVADEGERDAALADGWHLTTPDAKAAADAAALKATEEAAAATAAAAQAVALGFSSDKPTREELEKRATELKIEFSARVSDKKLLALITAATEG
jgi:hypothetical protein